MGNEDYLKIRYNGEYVYLCERKEFECGVKEFKERLMEMLGEAKNLKIH